MLRLAQSDFLFEAADLDADLLLILPLIDFRADRDLLRLLLELFGVRYLLLYYYGVVFLPSESFYFTRSSLLR